MAVKGNQLVTFLDVAKKGNKIAEVLMLKNSMLKDIPYREMNERTIHKETIRSFVPKPIYRKANQGLKAQKGGTEERTFSASHFESRSQVEKSVAQRGGIENVKENRFKEAQAHLQGMANEHADLTVYGSAAGEGNKDVGFNDIYFTTNPAVETSKQIVNFGGTGSDNTSIYMVNWGEDKIFGVYPKGTQAGIKRTDYSEGGKLVQLQLPDADGNPSTYYGYDEIFELDHGLVVKDYRNAVRIANIDVSDLIAAGSTTAPLLVDALITGLYKLDTMAGTVIYMNRVVHAILHKMVRKDVISGGGLSFMNYGGEQVLSFNGLPIRIQDNLKLTESQVTT